MRLRILSDLHLEFGPWTPPAAEADVVILAGDIHAGKKGCQWIRRRFSSVPVIYVLGNHEFYRNSLPALTGTLERENEGGPIHLLENKAVELNGFSFLGCTLWTDFRLTTNTDMAMRVAEDVMNDYILVQFSPEGRRLRARDTARLHAESVAWLKAELSRHDPARTVVVTHHGPSPVSIPPLHAGSPLNAAFVSNLDGLVEQSGVLLWIHGHTHYNVDYRLGSTRVLSNQRGYPNELAPGFQARMVVEI
jgi:predicted phosphodiesterase